MKNPVLSELKTLLQCWKYKNVNNSVQITWNKMKQNFFMCIARHNNVYFSSMHAQRFFCFYCFNHYYNALISTLLSGFCLICTHPCKTLTNQRRFKIKSLWIVFNWQYNFRGSMPAGIPSLLVSFKIHTKCLPK